MRWSEESNGRAKSLLIFVCMALLFIPSILTAETFYSFTMDSNPGWSTGENWAFGRPLGGGSHNLDPVSGFTGANVYGYNLSGDYTDNMPQYWLTTTALNCSGHENVVLKFRRWLGVESSSYDHADIEISNNGSTWSSVWSHSGSSLGDSLWQEITYDISAVADGQPTVYIRWGMGPTDGSVTYPGWNIDDVQLEGDPAYDLRISPNDTLVYTGYEGGPFSPYRTRHTYTLVNNSSSKLDWAVLETCSWLNASPTSGSLAAGPRSSAEVSLLQTPAMGFFLPGNYTETVLFSNLVTGFIQARTVELEVLPLPGEVEITDSIAPTNDLDMSFGDIITNLSRTGQITIHNTDQAYNLVISDISFEQYTEDFNDGVAQNWHEDLDTNWEVVSGEYRSETSGTDFMFATYGGEEWTDITAQVSCRRTGSGNNSASLLLRATADFDQGVGSGYVFQISTGGLYSIWKQVNGVFFFLQSWTSSPEIFSDTNVLAATAQGNTLSFFINSTLVWSGTDSELAGGRIGLGGYSSAGNCTHYFDNVVAGESVVAGNSISSEQTWYNARPSIEGNPALSPKNLHIDPYSDDPDLPQADDPSMLADLAAGGFSLTNLPAFPYAVPPGGSLVVDVVCTPATLGTLNQRVAILSNDMDEPEVLVSLSGTGILDYLTVTPDEIFISRGHPGGPFTPSGKNYVLGNSAGESISWETLIHNPWITVSPAEGTIPAGESSIVNISINNRARFLSEGYHTNNVTFSNLTTSISHNRTVILDVFTAPEIIVEPSAGFVVTNRPGQLQKCTLAVSNALTADGMLDFSVSTSETGREELLAMSLAVLEPPNPNRDFTKAASGMKYNTGRLLVRFAQGINTANQHASIAALGGNIRKRFNLLSNLCVIELNPDMPVEQALKAFNKAPGIVYAQPDYVWHAENIPNDPSFSSLWGMNNTGQSGGTADADIDAPEAWETETGDGSVVIAVIDTGVDYTHPDLDDNMWVNSGEIANNGIDDDGNGYVDDVYGYDFVNNDGDPMDDQYHGTHCAGTIGAEGNNGEGVVGVCWDVRIMALKFLDSGGSGSTIDAISCIEYAMQMGAKVLSNSWGGGAEDQALKDAIDAAGALDILFVAAAGNEGVDNDVIPHYPSSYDSDNIIAVVNTDHNDAKAASSCYGLISTDLAAPGSSIYSCSPGGGYRYLSGTSMATPHVAGACALLLSLNPNFSALEIKQILMESVDLTLPGICASEGRLNLSNALTKAGAPWLIAEPSFASGIAPGESYDVLLYFDAVATPPGVYTGEVTVVCNDPVTPTVTIPALMYVEPYDLSVLPNDIFEAEGLEGGPFTPGHAEYTLRNNGTAPIEWMITTPPWLDASPANGILDGNTTGIVEVAFNDIARGQVAGLYEDSVVIYDLSNNIAFIRIASLDIQPRSRTLIYEFLLDSDPGWTTQGQWEFGPPLAGGSHNMDPSAGFTGTNVYGYNLMGDYQNNMHQHWLTTTALDCSGHTNVVLRFKRWLGVEYAEFDGADIKVSNDGLSWHDVWSHTSNSIVDTSWQSMSYDISAIADNQPAVYIRWGMGPTDDSVTYPGWNIDDVVLDGHALPDYVDHFTWSYIAPTQNVGKLIYVTLTAWDAFGSTATSFNQSVNLSGFQGSMNAINIAEVNPNNPDAVEFINTGTSAVDVSGWKIYIYELDTGWPTPQAAVTIPAGSICPPEEIFTIEEFGVAPGSYPNFYTGININWDYSSYGAALLVDDANEVVDFMCFGSSDPALISQPFAIPSAEWTGISIPPLTSSAHSHQRQGNADQNDAEDWLGLTTGIGTINSGLLLPFSTAGIPISIDPVVTDNFVGGIWNGAIMIPETATNACLIADDDHMHTGESQRFNVIFSVFDQDGDGISDFWESRYFGHHSNCVWYADSDSDGRNNRDEFIAGTNPVDPGSLFALTGCYYDPDRSNFVLEWPSFFNRDYLIYWSPNLIDGFQMIESDIAFPQNSYTDVVERAASQGFYKIEVRLQ